MNNPNETQFDANVFKEIVTEFTKTLETGEIYVAKDRNLYGTYILPFVYEILKATRLGSQTDYGTIIHGKPTVLDTYRVQNGKTFQVGYYSED